MMEKAKRYCSAALLTFFLATFICTSYSTADPASSPSSDAAPVSFGLLDAGERGAFDIGPAQGGASSVPDAEAGKNVLKFDFQAAPKSHTGAWTKKYPRALKGPAVDAVKIGVKVPSAELLSQVAVKVEIKGKKSWQAVPLKLKYGWNYFREPIQWDGIGALNEVVFVVSPIITTGQVEGILHFDLEFFKLSFVQKYFTFIKIALVLGLGLLVALLFRIFSGILGRKHDASGTGFSRDILYGIAAVALAGLAIRIFAMGTLNPLDVGTSYGFLLIGVLGMAVAGLLKFGLTGRHLTPGEALQNVILSGLLAASTGRMDILHAPASWAEVLTLNNTLAALAFLTYNIANWGSLASSGKHLRPVTGALIVGAPYFLNWLMVVEDVGFVQTLINGMTNGVLAAKPVALEIIGRVLVLFIFNEIVTNSISLITRGKTIKTGKAHLLILLVSLGVAVSARVADLGSGENIASMPAALGTLIAVVTTMISFGGLWGEVYLITGMALDCGHRTPPTLQTITDHVSSGVKKGMAYSGILMALLYALHHILGAQAAQKIMSSYPLWVGSLAGALLFPFLKTIIETFDGSLPFLSRVRFSYRDKSLLARGAISGFGFAYALSHNLIAQPMGDRVLFGLSFGLLASVGVSFLRDASLAVRNQGSVQTWRLYLVDGVLGVFVGSALAFYLDALQVPVIIEKFKLYTSAGFSAREYITYPLLNKWGRIDLGTYSGGSKLLFTESLAGVINWSIAAWLFAINKVFLQSLFERQTAPIKFFFSKDGFSTLVEHMIYVLRWGLWMSPIIFTFLRMMPDPTWYNQDGAIRSLFAIYNNATMSEAGFRQWSLTVFVYLMAFDLFRILIWMDHMGLRVATLVNLSFIGMDKLDEKIAKFIGPAAAQRYIPEGVKRFTTWGPLLIPFFLPRGAEWDYVWGTSEAMQNAARVKTGGLLLGITSLPMIKQLFLVILAVVACAMISLALRALGRRLSKRRVRVHTLANRIYRVHLKETGEIYSELDHHKKGVYPREYDITRRSYNGVDPCGRILFLLDPSQQPQARGRFWPVVGNFPHELFQASLLETGDNSLKIVNESNGIQTTVEIRLPDQDSTAEIWDITVQNLTTAPRSIKIVPYLEWLLNGGLHDRFHTQYQRLFPEMEYVEKANAVLSWQKSTKSMGFLAADSAPEGILTSRMDFIGRAQSIWKPRILETLDFLPARDMAGYPTFDPIGSLLVDAAVPAKGSKTVRLVLGYAKNRDAALQTIGKYLKPRQAPAVPQTAAHTNGKRKMLIGHGEILPGTPQPYSEFIENGNTLRVHTPFTPRPYDHAMSNAMHSVMVTNRGLHTTCNGNSQQNRLTPDWPDMVTKETPAEAIYLYDVDAKEWYSPAYHPLNDSRAKYECDFSVDGTAIFRMDRGAVSTELTVFVPPNDPLGVYLLTVKNNSDQPKRMRVAPYFEMVLEFQPERSGTLQMRRDKAANALYFHNPRNMFRTGWAFVSMTSPAEVMETNRGRFFGIGRSPAHPYLVDQARPDAQHVSDVQQIAGMLTTLTVPAGQERTVAVVLGQTDAWKDATRLVQKYGTLEGAQAGLKETRNWWLSLMKTAAVETSDAQFNDFQNWLKYQALAERIWARRGFYQTSGAYGFRDQLQDTVNLMWVDPALARKQILLHASQQFIEGDVFHWFFTLTDGRTAFSCRSHASDNPVWLPWATVEYLRSTGDKTILDEKVSYVESEFPFADLPKNKEGWGHLYHRSTRQETLYKHCMRSIDLILKRRTGKNGIPHIRTGDWNDGLDEIGSKGKGESIWLGFFLYYILKEMLPVIEQKEGKASKDAYAEKLTALAAALEKTWRNDRYLRAIHDDGTEIGVKGSGIWETDALTAAWAVYADINFERAVTSFNTALGILEKDNAVLLGWPALREDSKPYLGRSSKYPEGVRENGMYCHGVQWLVRAARLLAEKFEQRGDQAKADEYRAVSYRLWLKISPILHTTPQEIEIYGGQPNKQAADILTNYDQGRMIWHGYTGAAGWMLRQVFEGVTGATLQGNELVLPKDMDKPRGGLNILRVHRDLSASPFNGHKSAARKDSAQGNRLLPEVAASK